MTFILDHIIYPFLAGAYLTPIMTMFSTQSFSNDWNSIHIYGLFFFGLFGLMLSCMGGAGIMMICYFIKIGMPLGGILTVVMFTLLAAWWQYISTMAIVGCQHRALISLKLQSKNPENSIIHWTFVDSGWLGMIEFVVIALALLIVILVIGFPFILTGKWMN